MAAPTISIGELARRVGCHIETIRYYERIGLTPKPARRGRYRSYSQSDIRRLGFILRARELGFGLERVRTLLRLTTASDGACAEARSLAASHLRDVRERISDLRRIERALTASVKACDATHDPGCPLIASLNLSASGNSRSSPA